MPKQQLTRKQREQRAAEHKREAKRIAHEAMLVRHAERRAAIAVYESCHAAWLAADCIGPKPLHPFNEVTGYIVSPDAGTADLLAAADELSIDLSGVKAE